MIIDERRRRFDLLLQSKKAPAFALALALALAPSLRWWNVDQQTPGIAVVSQKNCKIRAETRSLSVQRVRVVGSTSRRERVVDGLYSVCSRALSGSRLDCADGGWARRAVC